MSLTNDVVIAGPGRLYDAYIFDLDGTIYLGDEPLPGAARLISELRRRGIPVRFLSNNPTKAPQQYASKLTAMGIPTVAEDVVNTVVTTVHWLRENYPEATVFPVGEAALVSALEEAGIAVSEDPAEIDIVLASYDRGFDYRKLQIAFDAIWFHRRAFLMATNPDRYCPFPGGRGEPDCAAVIAAIEACTAAKCQVVVGKPNPLMVDAAISGLGIRREDCLMVGDRLGTDIQLAIAGGMSSAMPLTGESTLDDVRGLEPSQRPSFIVDRIDRLIPAVLWDEATDVE